MTTSNEFKAARLAAGLTQKNIVDTMLVPRRTLQDWEASKYVPPAYVRRWYLAELQSLKK